MEKTFDFLKNRVEYYFLATIDGDKPSCRPFGATIVFDGKIYMMSHAGKKVANQLEVNNNACIVAYDGDAWIRINCKMIDDSDNIEAKKALINEFEWAEMAGYTIDAPDFKVYYLADADSTIYDEEGGVLEREQF